jgi:hypothetical protein
VSRRLAALILPVAVVVFALAPAAAVTVPVQARLVIGFTDVNGADLEAAGLLEGKPFRRGAMELRGKLVDGVANGALRFRGTLDSNSVPAVTVLPATLRGKLHVHRQEPRPPLARPLPVDLRGKAAKVRFKEISADPVVAKLTTAQATAMERLGNGVLIETDDVDERTRLWPKTVTFYGPDARWTAKGNHQPRHGTEGV